MEGRNFPFSKACQQEAVYFENLIWVTKILILFGQDPNIYPRMYPIGHKLSGGPCPGFVSGESVAPANRDTSRIRNVHCEGETRLAKSLPPALTLTNAQLGLLTRSLQEGNCVVSHRASVLFSFLRPSDNLEIGQKPHSRGFPTATLSPEAMWSSNPCFSFLFL